MAEELETDLYDEVTGRIPDVQDPKEQSRLDAQLIEAGTRSVGALNQALRAIKKRLDELGV